MLEPLSGPISEPAIVQTYDQKRRLGLTRVIAPGVAVLLGLFTVVFTIYLVGVGIPSSRTALAFFTVGVLFACVMLFLLAAVAARRGRMLLATRTTIVGAGLTIVSFAILWAFVLGNGLDPVTIGAFAATGIAIALAGVLGDSSMIIIITVAMNAFVVLTILFAPPLVFPGVGSGSWQYLLTSEQGLFGPMIVLEQWVFAVIMLASTASFRRTLGDIGAAYVQIRRLDQLDQLKDQFITNVNHELRNPTMALQGYVELLRLRHEKVTPERRGQLIERAARASDDLVALLTSVLETQRFDSGAEEFTAEAVNVRATIEDAARLIDPREGNMIERELHVHIPEALEVWGEQVRLRQILTNLLSNALKYSGSGTPVEVSAHTVVEARPSERRPWRSTASTARQMVEIQVRDYGLGIPPEQMPLLFKRFVRLPRDLASNVVGNGLGLHLCRTLAEAMGGTIWVESTGVESEGSTFIVRLPAPPVVVTPAQAVEVISFSA
jgi:signal transduction histidine kinase